MATATVSFEKGKSYKLKTPRSIQGKNGQWLPAKADIEILRDNEDKTLLVKLPDGSLATCADFMLEAPEKVKPEYADFGTRVVGDKEEKVAIPEGKEVLIGGKKFIEREVPLLFETGDYPDKEFSMTPEEGQEVYDDFMKNVKEVPVPISHKATVLDAHNGSKLNHIEYKIIERDGKRIGQFINGKVLLESYLDPFLTKEKTWGLSARFENKEGKLKRLVHAALVPNPRIEKARIAAGSDFEKALAEFAKEMVAGATIPGNADGKTEDTDEDLPPIPPEKANASAPVLPKESPTGEELQEAENGGKGSSSEKDALEELGNYDEEEAAEGQDASLHGPALWDKILTLIERAQKETSGDSTRSPAYLDQLEKVKAMMLGNKGAPPTVGKAGEDTTPVKPVAGEFSDERKKLDDDKKAFAADQKKQDERKAKDEADFAVESKRIAPHEYDVVYAGLVKSAKADRALGIVDFDHADSLYGNAVKQLRARKSDPTGMFKTQTDFSLIAASKGENAGSKETKEKEMDQLSKIDPVLARAREFNRNKAKNN